MSRPPISETPTSRSFQLEAFADDLLPLIAVLTPYERARLVQLIASPKRWDESVYASTPPRRDEFWSDDESLAWEAEGWEKVG